MTDFLQVLYCMPIPEAELTTENKAIITESYSKRHLIRMRNFKT